MKDMSWLIKQEIHVYRSNFNKEFPSLCISYAINEILPPIESFSIRIFSSVFEKVNEIASGTSNLENIKDISGLIFTFS